MDHSYNKLASCSECGDLEGCHKWFDVFVFGSNLAGIHGAGSALHARRFYGALVGVGEGRQGMSYAIPTKNTRLQSLSLTQIQPYINDFLLYAVTHRHERFHVVAIGCGLAGFTPEQIAPFFETAPENVMLPYEFEAAISREKFEGLFG